MLERCLTHTLTAVAKKNMYGRKIARCWTTWLDIVNRTTRPSLPCPCLPWGGPHDEDIVISRRPATQVLLHLCEEFVVKLRWFFRVLPQLFSIVICAICFMLYFVVVFCLFFCVFVTRQPYLHSVCNTYTLHLPQLERNFTLEFSLF